MVTSVLTLSIHIIDSTSSASGSPCWTPGVSTTFGDGDVGGSPSRDSPKDQRPKNNKKKPQKKMWAPRPVVELVGWPTSNAALGRRLATWPVFATIHPSIHPPTPSPPHSSHRDMINVSDLFPNGSCLLLYSLNRQGGGCLPPPAHAGPMSLIPMRDTFAIVAQVDELRAWEK